MSDEPDIKGNPILDAAGHIASLRSVLVAGVMHCDAALVALGAEIPKQITLTEPGVCPHPKDKVKDYTPAGHRGAPHLFCSLCGKKVGDW